MGFRYYATVSFPEGALAIDEIRAEALGGESLYELQDEGPPTVVVSKDDANYGNMDCITDLLDENQVPYDHYHSESEGSESTTLHVRYADGARSETWIGPEQEAQMHLAEELLMLLDDELGGKQSEVVPLVTGRLRQVTRSRPTPIDDIEWEPVDAGA